VVLPFFSSIFFDARGAREKVIPMKKCLILFSILFMNWGNIEVLHLSNPKLREPQD
jgi:hypothetical protein